MIVLSDPLGCDALRVVQRCQSAQHTQRCALCCPGVSPRSPPLPPSLSTAVTANRRRRHNNDIPNIPSRSQGPKSHLSSSTEEGRDNQREGVVVLLGSTAKYLAPSDPKVRIQRANACAVVDVWSHVPACVHT